MKPETLGNILGDVVVAAVAVIIGVIVGFYKGSTLERMDAVRAGVAEWRVDTNTGARSFHYIKSKEATP